MGCSTRYLLPELFRDLFRCLIVAWAPEMKTLFWLCFALTAYAYVGYMVWLWVEVWLRRRPVRKEAITPSVSIIIAARNEEVNLPAKLENLRQLNYPAERIQIVVASDGSTDRTAEILRQASPGVLPVILEDARGKAGALNEAVTSFQWRDPCVSRRQAVGRP